jgi:hypothetical protein
MTFRWEVSVQIPTGATGLSAPQDFGGGAKDIGVIVPADWVAAHITYQVSTAIDGAYVNLYNEVGTEVNSAVVAGETQVLNVAGPLLSPFRYVTIRSGTNALPVNQTASSTLKFIFQR